MVTASSGLVRRWGAGTSAIARYLVAAEAPISGKALACAIGVSQPRASQVLKQLSALEAVRATPKGYVGRRSRLFELYEQRARPILVEPESYWYSTAPLPEQADRVRRGAEVAGSAIAFSADLAPDLLVPWRHPTLTIVYAAEHIDLESARFVPAEGRADATLVLRHTSDLALLRPSGNWPMEVDGLPLTDPVQQWRDLLDLGGEDRSEAAGRLRRAILDRTITSRTSR
jgi:hypothetical protein